MTEIEAIHRLLGVLEENGIEYMIVGSYAASLHGFVRATHDLDLVACLTDDQVEPLASALGNDFYMDMESACMAVERRDMFNIVQVTAGIKVDFWILHDDEFSRTQFSRRLCSDFEGVPAFVASAEDTILSKLQWHLAAASERQLDDVRGILAVKKDALDWNYLQKWASRLGVEDVLRGLADAS